MTSQTPMREGQRKTTPGLNSCITSPVHSAYKCQSFLSHFLTKCSTSKPQICVPIGSRSCWSISESLKDNFLLQLTVSKMSPSQTWGIQRVLRWGSRQRQRERCRNLTSGKCHLQFSGQKNFQRRAENLKLSIWSTATQSTSRWTQSLFWLISFGVRLNVWSVTPTNSSNFHNNTFYYTQCGSCVMSTLVK